MIRKKNQPPPAHRQTVTQRREKAEFTLPEGLVKCCATCDNLFEDVRTQRHKCNRLNCNITDRELSAVCKHHKFHIRPEKCVKPEMRKPRIDKRVLNQIAKKVELAEKYAEETGKPLDWAVNAKRLIDSH